MKRINAAVCAAALALACSAAAGCAPDGAAPHEEAADPAVSEAPAAPAAPGIGEAPPEAEPVHEHIWVSDYELETTEAVTETVHHESVIEEVVEDHAVCNVCLEIVDGEVEECHHSRFSIGVAGYPETHAEAASPETDIAALKAKIDAGAEYIVTQLFYDNGRFFDFVKRCREAGIGVPIIPGIKPHSTVRHLRILPETFGCRLPAELVAEVERHADDPKAVREIGTEWAIAQSRELMRAGVPVLHYYPMGKADNIIRIARELF